MTNPIRVSTVAFVLVSLVAIATSCGTPFTESPPAESPPAETAPPTAEAPPLSNPEAIPEDAPPPVASPPNPVPANKRDCGEMATQQEMNSCAQANYNISDQQLNQVYQTIKGNQTAAGQASLSSAEKAWLAFRDAECAFERSRVEGGSIAPLIFSSCMEQMTDIRVNELQSPLSPEQSYEQADQQLNQVYQALQAAVPAGIGEQVKTVQLLWLKYRDSHCAFAATHATPPINSSQCLARMTETRTQQLQVQLDQWNL